MTTRRQKQRLEDAQGRIKGRTLRKFTRKDGSTAYATEGSGRIVKLARATGTRPNLMPAYAFRYITPGPKTTDKISNE